MSYDSNNIFAKILRGEIPCHRVYEDDKTLAFMDIMPQVEGHTLVIPKAEAITLFDLEDEAALACMRSVKLVGKALQLALDIDGCSTFQHNGESAGQSVPHCHFHIIPGAIFGAAGLKSHARVMGDADMLQATAEKIAARIDEAKVLLAS